MYSAREEYGRSTWPYGKYSHFSGTPTLQVSWTPRPHDILAHLGTHWWMVSTRFTWINSRLILLTKPPYQYRQSDVLSLWWRKETCWVELSPQWKPTSDDDGDRACWYDLVLQRHPSGADDACQTSYVCQSFSLGQNENTEITSADTMLRPCKSSRIVSSSICRSRTHNRLFYAYSLQKLLLCWRGNTFGTGLLWAGEAFVVPWNCGAVARDDFTSGDASHPHGSWSPSGTYSSISQRMGYLLHRGPAFPSPLGIYDAYTRSWQTAGWNCLPTTWGSRLLSCFRPFLEQAYRGSRLPRKCDTRKPLVWLNLYLMYGERSSYLHLLFHIADILDCLEYRSQVSWPIHGAPRDWLHRSRNSMLALSFTVRVILRLGIKVKAMRQSRPLVWSFLDWGSAGGSAREPQAKKGISLRPQSHTITYASHYFHNAALIL